MVTKKENQRRVKVGKLKLNKDSVRELTRDESQRVKGGGATSLPNAGGGGGAKEVINQKITGHCNAQ